MYFVDSGWRNRGVGQASVGAFPHLCHSLKSQLRKIVRGKRGKRRQRKEWNPRHGSGSHSGGDWSRHDRILCCSVGCCGTGNLSMGWYFGNFNPETLCGWDPVMDDLSSFLFLTFSSIGLFIGPKQICFCNTIVFLISLHCISHWHCPIKSSHWIPLTACQRFQTGSNFNRGQRRARWCWWDFLDYSKSLVFTSCNSHW